MRIPKACVGCRVRDEGDPYVCLLSGCLGDFRV